MSDKSRIEWTNATWNPVTGCMKISQGCKHCYAKRDWARLAAMPGTVYHGRAFEDVRTHAERLDQPLRWRKPRRVFVNSMSDLFHEDVPDEFIDQVFAIMALSPQHTFQVLTKRPERLRAYLSTGLADQRIWYAARPFCQQQMWDCYSKLPVPHPGAGPGGIGLKTWPIKNVWLGVSVEDQATADERIPLLLQTPAAQP